jgi:DNA-binding phage protein
MDMGTKDDNDLAQAIHRAMKGLSIYRVAKDAKVPYQAAHRFAHGGDITLKTASRICRALGLELVQRKGR